MPRNPNFTLETSTLGVVYPTEGVLLSSGEQNIREPIIGAYYDTNPDFEGLYIVLPGGDVYYFDIEDVSLRPSAGGAFISFSNNGSDYFVRPVIEDDGEWLSKYKTALPKDVLSKKIALDSHDALEKFMSVDLGEPLPFFEAIYAYFEDGFPNVVAVTYVSSFGTFLRSGAEWVVDDISADMYENWAVLEIDPEKANDFVSQFDEADGVLSVEIAVGASLDSSK